MIWFGQLAMLTKKTPDEPAVDLHCPPRLARYISNLFTTTFEPLSIVASCILPLRHHSPLNTGHCMGARDPLIVSCIELSIYTKVRRRVRQGFSCRHAQPLYTASAHEMATVLYEQPSSLKPMLKPLSSSDHNHPLHAIIQVVSASSLHRSRIALDIPYRDTAHSMVPSTRGSSCPLLASR